MFKKIILTVITAIVTFACINVTKVQAADDMDYLSFSDLFYTGGKLISDWSDEEMKTYMDYVKNNKAFGWTTYQVTNRMKVIYERTELYNLVNQGTSTMDMTFTHDEKSTIKHAVNVKGDLGYNVTNKGKELTQALSAAIKADYGYTFEEIKTEKVEFKYKVDPGTRVRISIHGVGHITNGTANHKFFWFTTSSGAYEIFVTSGESFYFEKLAI
jgi:hypothetical protein